MRCSFCRTFNPLLRSNCATCGARLVEEKHREVVGVGYLLDQVGKWEGERRYTPEILAGLKTEYGTRRDALRTELSPPPPPPVIAAAAAPVRAPAFLPPDRSALRVEAMHPVKPARPASPPPPPKPPFSWKNLYTEQNIRWVLNLGIFIFSIALGVFIRTQWKEMTPPLKVGILYGASFAAMGAGHLLRRTILKATGMALVLLGAIAVPIDCAALVEFGIVGPGHADQVGLWGSLFSLSLYVGLARLHSEPRFLQLASLGAVSLWAFLLRICGLPWSSVVPGIAPITLLGIFFGSRPVRQVAYGALGLSLLLSAGLLGVGALTVGRNLLVLQAALASIIPAALLAEGRTGRREFQWGTVAALGAMVAVAAGHSGRPLADHWLTLALVSAACSLGWWRRSAPFVAAGIVAGIVSLAACAGHWDRLTVALALPAAVHVAYGLAWNDERHAASGWLLAAAALLAGMQSLRVPDLWQPLALAGYGALVVAVSQRRTPRTLQILGTLAAGLSMILLAAWYSRYYLPRPSLAVPAPPGGQWQQLLGAAIAFTAALSFGPLANACRSRFLSDITYGCLGFSYILVLRWMHVPGKWLGLSVALFGLAYVLCEKRVSRWLLRPTFFTGVASTAAAGVLAFVQWFVFREYLQSSMTLFLIGGFYAAVAARTPMKGLYHVGVYLITAGWLVALEGLSVYPEARALLTFVPAALVIMASARRRILHLGLAALVVGIASLAVAVLDPSMYANARAPYLMAGSFAAAVLAGWLAFSWQAPRELDDRVMSALMGVFASAAYLLWLKTLSTGRPWGGLVVYLMTLLLCGSGEILRRAGFLRQALPLVLVSWMTTAAALLIAHEHGYVQGVHLWVYGGSWAAYSVLAWSFRREELGWAGALAGGAGLLFWLAYSSPSPWIGVLTFPLAALALQRKNRPLWALGLLALVASPAASAFQFRGTPAAGVVFLLQAVALAATTLRPASLYPLLLGLAVSWSDPTWGMIVSFSGFALYLAVSLGGRRPEWIYASLTLALLGDYLLALRWPGHEGLAAYPLAVVLLMMAREVGRRFGREFGAPLLGASLLAAALATVLGLPMTGDRIIVFLSDAILCVVAAVLFRRPALIYAASASLVALALSFMWRYDLPRTQMAFYLLTLSLAKIIFVRACGQRLGEYLKPMYGAALVVASGVLLFGLCDSHQSLRGESLSWSIWGLILVASVFGIAGRIRRVPAFIYLAGANLLGAYYLALHKYRVDLWEAYTLPVGLGVAIWAALGTRESVRKVIAEALAVGVFFLPSALQSFDRDRSVHTLYALAIAFVLVLVGMGMKRRAYVFGASGAFVLEVLGKAIQFLVDQKLSAAGWGMLVGGLMILLAAIFESRKARIVREHLELVRAGAQKYFATWE